MSKVVAEYLQCIDCQYIFRVDKIMAERGLTTIFKWRCPCGLEHQPDMTVEQAGNGIEGLAQKPKAWPGQGNFQDFWENQLGIFGMKPMLSPKPLNWYDHTSP